MACGVKKKTLFVDMRHLSNLPDTRLSPLQKMVHLWCVGSHQRLACVRLSAYFTYASAVKSVVVVRTDTLHHG